MVRILLWIGIIAMLMIGAGYGAGQLLASRAASMLSGGGQASAVAVRSSGFPARIGVEIEGLSLRSNGNLWQVPRLTATAPVSYPLRWTLDAALPQQVELAGQRLALTATALDGSFALAPAAGLPLAAITARLVAPELASDTGPFVTARSLDLDVARVEGAVYNVDLHAKELTLPPALLTRISPVARLPDAISSLSLRGSATFDTPPALFGAQPKPTALTIAESRLVWGGSSLAASGTLAIGADGMPEGVIDLSTPDWQNWLDFALAGGFIDRRAEQMVRTMAGMLAAQSPDGVLTLPLSFRKGIASLGPIPLGPAPRVY